MKHVLLAMRDHDYLQLLLDRLVNEHNVVLARKSVWRTFRSPGPLTINTDVLCMALGIS